MRNVDSFRLPDGASRLDRATLAVWRAWAGWGRPLTFALAAMTLATAGMRLLDGVTMLPRADSFVRYLAGWRPAAEGLGTWVGVNGGPLHFESELPLLRWGVAVQLVTAVVAGVAGWWVLRRHRLAVPLGLAAGLALTAAHLTAARLWTLSPLFPPAGRWLEAAAVLALWATPLTAAGLGAFSARSHRRS
jgi:hypothetical protein